ncbi:aminotransferase class I/II-fold pyridoxal phosphate-dependent enzyme [soil metagenome]
MDDKRTTLGLLDDRTPGGIASAIARQITDGEFRPGDRLPTVRDVATELGVSPATVSAAWQLLGRAGLVVSRGRSGSFVRSAPRDWLPRSYHDFDQQTDVRLDLSRGTPDPELLPSLVPALNSMAARADTSSYQLKPDIPELHDLMRDTWPSPVESLTVLNGALDAIDRILASVARFGDRVAVESPGFPPFFELLEQYGLEPVPLALDARGVVPSSLASALGSKPVAVLLQPRAQNPTGVSMDAARAEELARVIARHPNGDDVVIIQDDHSSAISTADDVTLARWLPDQVLHIRSFSKTHGPDLRIAALGGPRKLVDRIVSRRLLGPGWTSRMLQTALHTLLTNPSSIAEVDHARSVYAERRIGIHTALAARGLAVVIADGINAWLPVADERAAIVRLGAAGILVASGSAFQLGTAADHIRVTVGIVRENLDQLAEALVDAARA